MLTKVLTQAETNRWLAQHAKRASFSVRYRKGKYHVYAYQSSSKTDPAQIWLSRHDSSHDATQAVALLQKHFA